MVVVPIVVDVLDRTVEGAKAGSPAAASDDVGESDDALASLVRSPELAPPITAPPSPAAVTRAAVTTIQVRERRCFAGGGDTSTPRSDTAGDGTVTESVKAKTVGISGRSAGVTVASSSTLVISLSTDGTDPGRLELPIVPARAALEPRRTIAPHAGQVAAAGSTPALHSGQSKVEAFERNATVHGGHLSTWPSRQARTSGTGLDVVSPERQASRKGAGGIVPRRTSQSPTPQGGEMPK